jgi:hypothetical protein
MCASSKITGLTSPTLIGKLEKSMKKIAELMKDRHIARIIDWDLHPFDAVTRYLEWGTNWSRGLDHAKACGEESAYFKINAINKPAKLVLVRQSHHDYEVISEVEAPQELIDESVEQFACRNAACGISERLRSWLKTEANKPA